MRFFLLVFALSCLGLTPLSAQQAHEAQLAQQYYINGEYEKAAILYEKLSRSNRANNYYFNRYISCLFELGDYARAEKVIKKALKEQPDKVQLYVTYGQLLERQNMPDKARQQYEKAIRNLPPNTNAVVQLAQAFTSQMLYDQAIRTYEKGMDMLGPDERVYYNMADLYRRQGTMDKAIENYLNSLALNPRRQNTLQSIFQRYFSEADFEELKAQLYDRIQKEPEADVYPGFLAWVFVKEKNYKAAFRQMKALDRRLGDYDYNIFNLGKTALQDEDYKAALQIFEYLADKGPQSPAYVEAQRLALKTKGLLAYGAYPPDTVALQDLEKEYGAFLEEFGLTPRTAYIAMELADLQAYRLNNLDAGIETLKKVVEMPNLSPKTLGKAKIALGDLYLIKGEIWEATLLYSQVDKAFEEDPLGHEARFKNARLFYYNGDFEWAQTQLAALKASTSKLIANDALELSIFITDNLGLDTTAEALSMYAHADLLMFQNRLEEAEALLNKLLNDYPNHALDDDVLYLQAQIDVKRGDIRKAIQALNTIVEKYGDGIRADNALFMMAELYEQKLKEPEKARELYEKLFIEYSDSTFAVEARKRFRKGEKEM